MALRRAGDAVKYKACENGKLISLRFITLMLAHPKTIVQ